MFRDWDRGDLRKADVQLEDDLSFGRVALQAAFGFRGIEKHVPRTHNRQHWHVKPPQGVIGEDWELHAVPGH